MVAADRSAVAGIISRVGNFNQAEIDCALELVGVYLNDPHQKDYHLLVAEKPDGAVGAYACWGPTPLTTGTYDLYWIATDPCLQGQGLGQALVGEIERRVRAAGGRLILVETSSKDSYAATIDFYRRLGYREEARIRDFYDVGDDRLVFAKRLAGQGAGE
ncbi:MAG: GNAT family N-acetyltransferase [Acidobacteria bacterium]|nr:GNAT family N-acetyltransferase [Acidobacteriota bacterium]